MLSSKRPSLRIPHALTAVIGVAIATLSAACALEATSPRETIGGTWLSDCRPAPIQIAPEPETPDADEPAEDEEGTTGATPLASGSSYRQEIRFDGLDVVVSETFYSDAACAEARGRVETLGRFRIGSASKLDAGAYALDLDYGSAYLMPLDADYAAELNDQDDGCAPDFWRTGERQEVTNCPTLRALWDEPFFTVYAMKSGHLYLGKYSARRHGRDPEHRAVNLDRESPLRKKTRR